MGNGGVVMKIALPMSTSKTQFYINQAYVEYLQGAGYEAVLISPLSNIQLVATECDGLLLPGGIDIDPIFYDEDNIASFASDPVKDDFERQVFYAFKATGKPVFGICRGFQLIMREFLRANPEYDEMFYYLQNIPGHSLADNLKISRTQPSHAVFSLMNIMYGDDDNQAKRMFVNSMHHQVIIGELPKKTIKGSNRKYLNLINGIVSVISFTRRGLDEKEDKDRIIVEGVDIQEWQGGLIRAVQWHPEELKDYALLHNFFGNVNQENEQENHQGE
jgi:gamma-glutamyl-gamma-aminobutyrate hydrolase PuuD